MVKKYFSDALRNRSILSPSKIHLAEESPAGAQAILRTFGLLKRCGASLACCVFAILLAASMAPRLCAQTAGTISGHVADTTGAVIPGAAVTLTNVATNGVRTTVTTGSGDYTFPNVPPGTYNIRVEHQGFSTASAQNVQLLVQQSLAQNFAMQVGSVSTSVTVSSAGTLLQVNNATVGTVIENQAITQLPLNGENYLSLVQLSANTNTLSPGQGQAGARLGGSRAGESISVAGQRIMFNHYTLDGINNTDVDFNTFVVQPSIDAIQEMKVQTGVYPAEFGYNASQVNVVSKSGSNQYHGSAFEFIRNNYADARGYNYQYPNPLPSVLPYKYNDYGFVLGGPITVPKVFNGRNRFFFMASDEWFSQISFGSATATLPTQAMMNGDFSQYTATNGGSVVPIYDPNTGVNGVGRTQVSCNGKLNVICQIDPISAKILQLYYHPAQTGDFTGNYRYGTHSTDKHDGFNLRADYYQSSKSQWAFRFSDGSEVSKNAGFPAAGGTTGSSIITNFTQYMGSNTWTLSPTVVNVASLGYTYFYNSLGTYSQGSDDDVSKIGIPGLSSGPSSTWGIPDFGFGTDRWSGIGDTNDGPYVTTDPDWSVNDKISWIRGKHSMDLGFQYDRQTFNELGNQFSRGVFNFQPYATANYDASGKASGGAGLADFLLGDVHDSTYAVQIAQANYVRNVEAAYFDDVYKITPRLTLTAGLRYELTPPWYDTMGNEFVVNLTHSPLYPSPNEPEHVWPYFLRQGNCNDAYQGINVRWVQSDGVTPVSPAPACANGQYSNSLMETDYTNWAPRIGLSFSPTASLVVRAGYGIYYNHDIANARFDMARNLAGRVTSYAGQAAGQYAGEPTMSWANAVGSGSATASIPPPYAYALQYDHKTSNSQVYLVDIQKQVGQDWSFETGYLGTLSRNLYGFRDANWAIPYGLLGPAGYGSNGKPLSINERKPYPNYGVIQLVHDIGYGNYNAFSFKVTKRYSKGLNIIGSYTYGKSLDDTSGIRTQQSALFPQNNLCLPCEYGSSDFDVRHRVVASVLYDLPIGQGRLWAPSSKIVDAAIGGWQISTIATFQSGTPFSLLNVGNVSNTDNSSYDRPNVVPGVPQFVSHKTLGKNGQWLNPAAFTPDQPGFLGNMRRNVIFGPGIENFDAALHKSFIMPYSEHHQLQIRFETFNTLNHTNPNNPGTIQNIPSTFGKITSGRAPRQLQLAARYTF